MLNLDTIDTISKTVALVVTTIGAGTAIYNTFFKGAHARKQAYYDSLLKPFLTAYKQNTDISAVKFVKSKVTRDNDNIPKYIFHLIDLHTTQCREPLTQQEAQSNNLAQQTDERLRKVLLNDYLNLYSNEYNKKQVVLETACAILNFFPFFMLFIFVFYGALMLTQAFLPLIFFLFTDSVAHTKHWQWSVRDILMGMGFACLSIVPLKLSEKFSRDMYTVKKKHIQKLIEKRFKNIINVSTTMSFD